MSPRSGLSDRSRTPSAAAVSRWGVAGLLGALAVAAGARLSFPLPGTDVPQTAQTLAVVLVGVFLGPGPGALALVVYLGLGAVGLPVFADGASGVGVLLGPTGGFLLAFVPAAALAGFATPARGGAAGPDFGRLFGALVAAHALVLLLGWGRLAFLIGPARAWSAGVAPFLLGGIAKSVLGAAIALVWLRWRDAGPGSE